MTLKSRAESAFLNNLREKRSIRETRESKLAQRDAQGRDLVGNKISRVLGIPLQLVRVRLTNSEPLTAVYEVVVDDELDPLTADMYARPEFDEYGRLREPDGIYFKYHGRQVRDLASLGYAVSLYKDGISADVLTDDELFNSYLEGKEQS